MSAATSSRRLPTATRRDSFARPCCTSACLRHRPSCSSYTKFTQDRFGLFWRVWLTRRLVGQYLADRAYLRIKQSATVENPDERIAEDVPRVHGDDAFIHRHVGERSPRGRVVLRSALDNQPAAVRRRHRVRLPWHARDDLPGPAADLAQLPAVGSRGHVPVEPDSRPRKRRIDCHLAPGRQADDPPPAASLDDLAANCPADDRRSIAGWASSRPATTI